MAARSWARLLRLSHPLSRPCSTNASPAIPSSGGFGVIDFIKSVGKGVEAQASKIEQELPELEQLLQVRTKKLKKMGIPCKHRKLILSFTEKYRQGLWRPKVAES